MQPKLTTFKINRLSHAEFNQKINELEAQYESVLGARETWDGNLKNCFEKIRMIALCKQYPIEEDLECQYEDKNSRDDDEMTY